MAVTCDEAGVFWCVGFCFQLIR